MTCAQFEGTVLWDTKLEFTDSELRLDMMNAHTGKASNEAERLELQEQMSDLAFKKMMESNFEAMPGAKMENSGGQVEHVE